MWAHSDVQCLMAAQLAVCCLELQSKQFESPAERKIDAFIYKSHRTQVLGKIDQFSLNGLYLGTNSFVGCYKAYSSILATRNTMKFP